MLARTLILKTAALGPVEKLVRKSFLFRPLVRRFIAGDTVQDGLVVADELIKQGFRISLDYLGENTTTVEESRAAVDAYMTMLGEIAESNCTRPVERRAIYASQGSEKPVETCNVSIKLTQCGLDQGDGFAEKNFRELLDLAKSLDNFVRIDMEGSDYTERTIKILENVFPSFPNTGTVLQSYLHRTPNDIQKMIDLQMRTRIVKGAYLEPEKVAIQDKKLVDRAYVEAAQRLMLEGNFPAIATHDAKIVDELNAFVAEKRIDKSRFEYQMLFGIRRDLQQRLNNEGYNVRVYLPLGDSWYPYFTRRLAERPANAFFILKSLFHR
ncbi:MAG: proline dehydrogenase family protein [Fimbriimonadaceae bacterium]|nr:proline dehydrogenase family protein [Fimbriimonadaceae bacterium]